LVVVVVLDAAAVVVVMMATPPRHPDGYGHGKNTVLNRWGRQ
jgi:hypothetical protein